MQVGRISTTWSSRRGQRPFVNHDGVVYIPDYPAAFVFIRGETFTACNYLPEGKPFKYYFFVDDGSGAKRVSWEDLSEGRQLEFKASLRTHRWVEDHCREFVYNNEACYAMEALERL